MRKVLSIILVLVACTFVHAKIMTLREIGLACIRVHAGNAWGSGCVIAETEDHNAYYALTNRHVVGSQKRVYVEFFRYGYVSSPIPAYVVLTKYRSGMSIDFAILRIEKVYLGNYKPNIIPLAPRGYSQYLDGYIATAGCPGARHLMFQEGHIIKKEGGLITFYPKPESGQSGSPIIANIVGKDGKYYTRYVGILTWSFGSEGGAQSSDLIYYALGQNSTTYRPVRLPVYYHELSETTPDMVPVPSRLTTENGKTELSYDTSPRQYTGEYAKASDGNLYPVFRNYDGNKAVLHPIGTTIVEWGLDKNGRKINESSGPFGLLPWQRPQPPTIPPGNSPFPQNPSPGNSPFPQNPPSIGAPWPGNAPTEQPTQELPKEDKPKEQSPQLSFFRNLLGNTFSTGLFTGGLIGLLAFIWSRFLKKKVIKRVDTLEDYVEQKVKKKWGPEMAKEARDAMEGVEDVLFDLVDDVLQTMRAEKTVAKGKVKEAVRQKLGGGVSGYPSNVSAHEVMKAVEEATKQVGDDKTSKEVTQKIKDLLKSAKK